MEDNHGDFAGRSKAVLAVTIITAVLSSLFVLFRMLSRAAIVKKISIDDYFMMLAWALALGLSIAICYGCAWGLGRHEAEIPIEWQPTLRKADYAFTVLYQPALMATKTSILAFYLSISTANRVFKWACIGTLVVVNCGGFALTMLAVFQCRPLGATFAAITPIHSHCTDVVVIYLSSAPLNIITDIAILLVPIPILTGMRLPRKTKVILIVTFSFGIFVAAVDVVRIAYLQSASMTRLAEIQNQMQNSNGSTQQYQTDFSYYAAFSFMWSVIEVNVGIMCACVPGLKPLVARFMPYLLRNDSDATSNTGSFAAPNASADLAAVQQVPSIPEDVHHRDFGSLSDREPKEEGEMGMLDFLTTPDMNELAGMHSIERPQTAQTNTSRGTVPTPPTFFDFVNMSRKKSLVHHTNRESVFPIAMVTVLFFIWGFEYGLLDVLNKQFQSVAHMTPGQSTGIHSAYFFGYLCGPTLVGRLVLKHWGFKACYTVGLAIYASGTLIFWPAAVLTSFPAFIITNFIVAFGLSILEVAANPFIALCGPAEYAEIRLNLSQGVQAIGSVVAPLIANRAFFRKSLDAPSLVDTQWAYLGISLATVALALLYYYLPLPEATDSELEDASERMDGGNKAKIGSVRVIWITLVFGVFGQFCYVGVQEVNGTTFGAYLTAIAPQYNVSNYMAIAHTLFAIGRFLGAGLNFFIKPRILLLGFFAGAIIFQALAMHYDGPTGTAMILMVFFMEGPLFSLIFAQALRGMGRHTKLASVFLTASISGGAVFPPISSAVATKSGAAFAFVVAIAVFAAGSLFAIVLNLHPAIRNLVDPIQDATAADGSRPSSTSSRALSFLSVGKKRRQASDGAEFKERRSPRPGELQVHDQG